MYTYIVYIYIYMFKRMKYNCVTGKFHLWKIPPSENSTYGQFHLWKILAMDNFTHGQFHPWQIPPIRTPTTETTYKGFAKYAVDAYLLWLESSIINHAGPGAQAQWEVWGAKPPIKRKKNSQLNNILWQFQQTIFVTISTGVKFTWKMRHVLNLMKNQFSYFSFWDMDDFRWWNCP